MILITGATGLVGSHLLLHFLKEGQQLRVLYRSEEKKARTLEFLQEEGTASSDLPLISWVKGDLLDIARLNEAIEGTDMVFHCAALISFDPKEYRKLRKVNIEGTANVVNACIEKGVKKLFYMSSIAALGRSATKGPITEEDQWNANRENNVYAITKYGAEMEIWRGSQEGLDCVVFNPGVILGEGVWDNSTGKLFKAIDKGLKYYPGGGTGFVDVKDVVEAIISALKKNISGERFILVGENLTFREVFTMIANVRGKKAPDKEAKPWLLELLWRLDWLRAHLCMTSRKLSKASARSAQTMEHYDNTKAREILDLQFSPVKETLARIARTV